MDKIEFISSFLSLKDISYEVLEWAENVSEDDFQKVLSPDCVMPPEVEDKLERFCDVCKGLHDWISEYRSICR